MSKYNPNMRFKEGKYKNCTIKSVAKRDLDYLYRVIDTYDVSSNMRNMVIRFFDKNNIPFKSVLTGKILKY